MSAYAALEIATSNGGTATGFANEVGALVPGMKGDAILVDLDRVARDPWIDPEFDIADAFVERAVGADVATVVIGGMIVVENHQPCTIDVEGLYREVRAFCAKGLTREQRARADLLRRIKPYEPFGPLCGTTYRLEQLVASLPEPFLVETQARSGQAGSLGRPHVAAVR